MVDENLQEATVPSTIELTFTKRYLDNNNQLYVSHITDNALFIVFFQPEAYTFYEKVNLSTLEMESRSFGEYINGWEYNCLKSAPLNLCNVLIWTDLFDGVGTLYWIDAFHYDENNTIIRGSASLNVLLVDCEPVGWGQDIRTFQRFELNKTVYYRLIIDGDNFRMITEAEYVAGEQRIITLQPINK
jgi:hypothetical protein